MQSLKLKEFSFPLESLFISNPSINQSINQLFWVKVKKWKHAVSKILKEICCPLESLFNSSSLLRICQCMKGNKQKLQIIRYLIIAFFNSSKYLYVLNIHNSKHLKSSNAVLQKWIVCLGGENILLIKKYVGCIIFKAWEPTWPEKLGC